jgi:hypothetical protein
VLARQARRRDRVGQLNGHRACANRRGGYRAVVAINLLRSSVSDIFNINIANFCLDAAAQIAQCRFIIVPFLDCS